VVTSAAGLVKTSRRANIDRVAWDGTPPPQAETMKQALDCAGDDPSFSFIATGNDHRNLWEAAKYVQACSTPEILQPSNPKLLPPCQPINPSPPPPTHTRAHTRTHAHTRAHAHTHTHTHAHTQPSHLTLLICYCRTSCASTHLLRRTATPPTGTVSAWCGPRSAVVTPPRQCGSWQQGWPFSRFARHGAYQPHSARRGGCVWMWYARGLGVGDGGGVFEWS
jgi:hypothetical protein